ncbi:hypothetical protein SAMN02983003_0606 [Devosia enhydra]|uniref:Uncharacterized protein n=1 Tax=Devosia enhydra TaxID=665118 RepID=A0A1K2HUC1_9HYPH|nr:hypothetical protein SAMN02983003_0606 [Devosia enhydra]
MQDCPLNLPTGCNPVDFAGAGRSLAAPYIVDRIAADRWQLRSPHGTNLGIHRTRKAAVTVGRALAGWRGRVVVSSRGR